MIELVKCPICGNIFLPAPLHSLTDGNGHFVCTPHCSNAARDQSEFDEIENAERKAEQAKERDKRRKERNKREKEGEKVERHGWKSPVVIRNKDGVIMKRFPTMSAAAKETGLLPATISQMCRGLQKQTGMYRFEYENPNGVKKKASAAKPVLQYTIFGEFVARHASATEASKKTGACVTSISNCCLGKQKHTRGFIFMFESEFNKIDKRGNEDEN